jgi:C1A family cysteine protease
MDSRLKQGGLTSKRSLRPMRGHRPRIQGICFTQTRSQSSQGVTDIHANLAVGRPVVAVFRISNSFFTVTPGELLQASAEPTIGIHAVIIVGKGKSSKDNCLLLRNSWGTGWGDGGYAWIHENYLTPRLLAAGTIT